VLLLAVVLPNLAGTAEAPATKAVTETGVTDTIIGKNGNCLSCHNNAGYLMQAVESQAAPPEDGCASASSRPAFLNAFVNSDFSATLHGEIGCTACHGGDAAAADKSLAHSGMKNPEAVCSSCHNEIADLYGSSLHGTLHGMSHPLILRSGEKNFEKLDPAWQADCASCHAGCSDCHLTRPDAVGGGLVKGHMFFRRAEMEDSCAICHGSRAGAEYLGKLQGNEDDVHFAAGMHCLDCHTNNLHGDGEDYVNRWQVKGRTQCTDCHEALPNTTTEAHAIVHQHVSCQVCHSQPYQNCFSCHATVDDGVYQRRAGHKGLDFKIGRNTVSGYPYDIVPLRNNPVSRDSFDHFGKNLLPDFDAYPTWKTAAPHNIRRLTSQNRNCQSCHGNASLFLQDSDLDPQGAAANRKVVITPARKLEQGNAPMK
jgi:thiosulfate/3-mercaptopyruvate sulfurtransferase